ncbi:MAG: anti-sigma factor family protein [Bryobacteraceae bacterium]
MTCAEVEIRLCDYVDGDLRGAQKSALEQHLAGCSGCTELAQDVQAAVGFIERAAIVEPPAELMTRILHQIPAGRQASAWRRLVSGFLGARLGGWFQSILQPRYVMGMAMTMLSFSMLAKFAGIQPRQLRPADLDPAKIWMSVDDRAHRVWDRAMKSYENLRWVIEIQSRLKEWSEQDQEQAQEAAARQKKAGGAGVQPAHSDSK